MMKQANSIFLVLIIAGCGPDPEDWNRKYREHMRSDNGEQTSRDEVEDHAPVVKPEPGGDSSEEHIRRLRGIGEGFEK